MKRLVLGIAFLASTQGYAEIDINPVFSVAASCSQTKAVHFSKVQIESAQKLADYAFQACNQQWMAAAQAASATKPQAERAQYVIAIYEAARRRVLPQLELVIVEERAGHLPSE